VDLPGFVDLQVNGYKGVDFSSPNMTEADFARACRHILACGTAVFLPAMVTSAPDVYEHNLRIMGAVLQRPQFHKTVPGIHIEGPFVSPKPGACGTHNPKWITPPDLKYLKQLVNWAQQKIKMITVAADVEGAEEIAHWCREHEIVVALGHHMADEDDLERLRRAGASALTHLGNGVPAKLDRHKNPIWAGLCCDGLSATMITDGHHIPHCLIKTFIRTKGIERCIVISDGSALTAMPPGRYHSLGSDVILEESGRIYNPTARCLAGSSATMLQCMNYLASLGLLTPKQLMMVGFRNPLRLLGIEPDKIVTGSAVVFDEKSSSFLLQPGARE